MDTKTNARESPRLADQAAKVAHETIERLRNYAADMEDGVGKKAAVSAEQAGAGLETRVKAIGSFIEANPLQAAAIAFGIGMWASQVFKSAGPMLAQADRVAAGTTRDKPAQLKVRKVA